jgi:F0F1-type ATP synthase membrane subunit b/b'
MLDGMMVAALLDLDRSLFVQLAIFLVTAVALNVLVFKPLFRVRDLRRERTAGMRERASGLREQATGRQAEYEQLYATIVGQGTEAKKAARERARKEEHELLDHAKRDADARRTAGAEAIAREQADAEKALAAEADALRGFLVQRVTK